MVSTRRSAARRKEQRPQPCRPTEEIQKDVEAEEEVGSRGASASDGGNGHTGVGENYQNESQKIDLSWFDKARLRVIAAAVCGFRCLLTLEPGLTNRDLNFVHFLARTTSLIVLLCLEYSWGLYPGHLNVNSYLNIDIMRMDLHHSFDAGIFFFLPTLHVLRKMLEFTEFNASKSKTRDKKKFYEEFSDATWTYELYTVSFDKHRSIHRRNVDTTIRIPDDITRHPDKGGYTEHKFPFRSMRNLVSHVQPFFVVANAFLHLHKLTRRMRTRHMAENESLQLVWQIGEIWLKPVPASFKDTRKGGENEMKDPDNDRISFLADKDSHADVKYQQKQVFYRRMLSWADELRSEANVFSKTIPIPKPGSRSGSNCRNQEADAVEDMALSVRPNESSSPRPRTRSSANSQPTLTKRRLIDRIPEEERMLKKGRLANAAQGALPTSSPTSPHSLRRSSRNANHLLAPVDLEHEINAYPSSPEMQIEDGNDFLLDFISSQIKVLHDNSNVDSNISLTCDDGKIADIAFRVLENRTADGQLGEELSWASQADISSNFDTPRPSGSRPTEPDTLSPIKTPTRRKRSSTLVVAHVEIPLTPSPSQASVSKKSSCSNRSMTLKSDIGTDTELDSSLPQGVQGKSAAPGTQALLVKPRSKKPMNTRAFSLPPTSTSRSIRISSNFTAKPFSTEKYMTSSRSSEMGPPNANNRRSSDIIMGTNSTDDQSTFIHIGQQIAFESLAQEFGCSVDEVFGIYSDVGDLKKTRKVLSRLSGTLSSRLETQISAESSLGNLNSVSNSDVSELESPRELRAPPGDLATSKVRSKRNSSVTSVAPLSKDTSTSVYSSVHSSSAPPSPISPDPKTHGSRLFLIPGQPRSTKKRSLSSLRQSSSIYSFSKFRDVDAFNNRADDGNDADESDVLLERKRRKNTNKKRKVVGQLNLTTESFIHTPPPTLDVSRAYNQASDPSPTLIAYTQASSSLSPTHSQGKPKHWNKKAKEHDEPKQVPTKTARTMDTKLAQDNRPTYEDRLDSLARSIELILRK